MSKNRKTTKRKPNYGNDEDDEKQPYLKPETKRGVMGVIIIALAAISFLGLFDLAGTLGIYIKMCLSMSFGITQWGFPIMLIIIGYFVLAKEEDSHIHISGYIGIILLILSINGLIHVIKIPSVNTWTNTDLLHAGGYIGMTLAVPLLTLTGRIASIILLIAIIIISLLIVLNTSIHKLTQKSFFWITWIAKIQGIRNFFHKEETYYEKKFNNDENNEEEYNDDDDRDNEYTEDNEDDENIETDSNFKKKIFKENQQKTNALITKIYRKKIDIPLNLLSQKHSKPTSGDIKANAQKIKKTFENFTIDVEMGDINIGPTVTQYTLKPADGIKLSRIRALNDDLALSLAAHPIRIEAPIPGKSLVGIEVPNQVAATVNLKDILTSKKFIQRESDLMIALGQDVSGEAWLADVSKMPHLLIAGATGSGKTICINSIIISLLYQNGPDDLRFIMVDPKRVELPIYNGIPHLITPVITDPRKTINALKWCIAEMDRRFEILSKFKQRDIGSYNKRNQGKMPYLVVVIDELADIMATSVQEVEAAIIRLSQMARAVGIHLILATQRPSVDVITGLIKANITSRIAFSVASIMDSRTILDSSGAEKLLGRGDMLFISSQMSKPKRIQGAYVSDNDIKKIVNYIIKEHDRVEYDDSVIENHSTAGTVWHGSNEISDDLYLEAKKIVVESKKASASLLQRRLKVGYARAARLIDMLEENGIVSHADGAKPREILIDEYDDNDNITTEDYDAIDSDNTQEEDDSNHDDNTDNENNDEITEEDSDDYDDPDDENNDGISEEDSDDASEDDDQR